MVSTDLSQKQRVFVALLYFVSLVILFKAVGGSFRVLLFDASLDSSLWFYAGAFMIILGTYVVEPYFTKPSDAIANTVAVLIALLGLNYKQGLVGYNFLLVYSIIVLVLGVLSIFLKDSKVTLFIWLSKVSYWFVGVFGASKVIFSLVFLLACYSSFLKQNLIVPLIFVLFYWICITFFDVYGMIIEKINKLKKVLSSKAGQELGQAIGCENPLLYKVEIDFLKNKPREIAYGDIVAIETGSNVCSVGMVINIKHLLNKKWLSIYLFQDTEKDIIKIEQKNNGISNENTMFKKDNNAYILDLVKIPKEIHTKIIESFLYKNKDQFVGYVSGGSNINIMNFIILRNVEESEQQISEGAILKTVIYNVETIYQVINGNTKEEHLEKFDNHGFIIGIARKLGKYVDSTKDLDVSKWMPSAYAPVFFAYSSNPSPERIKQIAKNSIGRLPGTDLEIPIKDFNTLVTHNTAILGILGIGKSCLAYELIKKIVDNKIKVICIDITNEYAKELLVYMPDRSAMDVDDINCYSELKAKYTFIHSEQSGAQVKYNYEKSGNMEEYKILISKMLSNFLFSLDTQSEAYIFSLDKKIKIFNPDYHTASRGEKVGFNVITTDLTQAEKTRIISEELFKLLMKVPLEDNKKAKVLLVFEEAHSLIPEWNSVAYEGDKSATNGTAKVILQGRKYGLGSLVITQRTANVSKSVLNQCNTIFALRVFDDTGKAFLGNYIGDDYSNTLATLDERRAVVIGKGLKLKQPVIIQLNDKQDVIS